MIELFTHVFQYISLGIIFLLTISSYSLLNRDEKNVVFGYRVNIMLTLLLHITLFMPVLINNINVTYLTLFGAQIAYLLLFPLIFRLIHRKANRLVINLTMILLAIGLPILTRLDRQKATKQFVYLVIISVLVLFIPFFLRKFESTRKMAAILGVIGLLMLCLVLVLSSTTYGANLSLTIGPISIQPSEFVKLTYVLLLATLFRKRTDFKRVIFVTLIAMAHTGVLVLSKDLGGALIYYGIYVAILYVATSKRRYPLMAISILAVGSVAAYFLFSHVRVRVTAWLDPWSVIEKQGYQVAQSLFSIADGEWLGTGIYMGSPGSVPVVSKDFIFSAICEELGGLFGICMIMLCLCLLLAMLKVAMSNSVALYKLVCVGMACAYGVQTFLTIGGAMKLIPSTGVTIPFVSYGGSSLMASMIMFGIVQGLFIKGNKVEAAKKLDKEIKEAAYETVQETDDGRVVVTKKVKVPNKKQQAVLKQDDTKTAGVIIKNHESRVIGYMFMLIFAACIGYLVYFIAIDSKQDIIVNNSYHLARASSQSEKVIRGSIIAADGVELALTKVNEEGTEVREYPFANMFAHAVGYTKGGTTGIENLANKYLQTATRTVSESLNEELSDKKKNGDNARTTINSALQYIAYTALGDKRGAVIAMEADTGDILAMVSKPDYNPNQMAEIWDSISEISSDESFLLNRATQGQYPPGSTFKLLTMLAYIRENPTTYKNFVYECNGSFQYGNKTMSCSDGHVHGTVDIFKALQESCNGAFASMGMSVSNKTLMNIADDYIFNADLGLDFSVKKSSLPINADTSPGERAQICIGQGAVTESPIHNAMITAAIANGGIMMKPRILDSIQSSTGNTVKRFETKELGRVMSVYEADILREAMLKVVSEGTGFNAASDQYYSAGKTGSAQYGSDLSMLHAWYTGYAWQEGSKKIVVSVVVEGGGSGGWNAAPVAKAIFDYYFSETK